MCRHFVFQPIVAQNQDSTAQITTQQVETPVNKGNADALLTHMPAPSFKIFSVLKGILGMIVLLLIGFLFSKDRKNIPWKTVVIGLIIQIILAIGVLCLCFNLRYFGDYGFMKLDGDTSMLTKC